MIVIGIFLAIEPRIYDRGIAWMLPIRHRERFYRIADHVGFTLRRLLFGRLVGMLFEGVFTWSCCARRRADGRAARPDHWPARLHPQHRRDHVGRADGRGRLQRRARQGLWAIFIYFFVQNVDGYLVVPYIARRTVDLAPALVLAMQLLMGALFGILGVLFADPILATIKVTLVDLVATGGEEGDGAEVVGREPAPRRVGVWLRRLLLGAAGLLLEPRLRCISAALGTIWTTWTSKSRSYFGPNGLPAADVAIGKFARDVDLVLAALPHLGQRLGEARETWPAIIGCGPP